jgi:hypothetical protein
MDYLPIQASAVPCERVFSSSAETDTKKRNRIGPTLMEALQMLKYSLKKQRLNFTSGWTTLASEMTEVELAGDDNADRDLLGDLCSAGEDAVDNAIRTMCESDDDADVNDS